jgi:hypothetical protein
MSRAHLPILQQVSVISQHLNLVFHRMSVYIGQPDNVAKFENIHSHGMVRPNRWISCATCACLTI